LGRSRCSLKGRHAEELTRGAGGNELVRLGESTRGGKRRPWRRGNESGQRRKQKRSTQVREGRHARGKGRWGGEGFNLGRRGQSTRPPEGSTHVRLIFGRGNDSCARRVDTRDEGRHARGKGRHTAGKGPTQVPGIVDTASRKVNSPARIVDTRGERSTRPARIVDTRGKKVDSAASDSRRGPAGNVDSLVLYPGSVVCWWILVSLSLPLVRNWLRAWWLGCVPVMDLERAHEALDRSPNYNVTSRTQAALRRPASNSLSATYAQVINELALEEPKALRKQATKVLTPTVIPLSRSHRQERIMTRSPGIDSDVTTAPNSKWPDDQPRHTSGKAGPCCFGHHVRADTMATAPHGSLPPRNVLGGPGAADGFVGRHGRVSSQRRTC